MFAIKGYFATADRILMAQKMCDLVSHLVDQDLTVEYLEYKIHTYTHTHTYMHSRKCEQEESMHCCTVHRCIVNRVCGS